MAKENVFAKTCQGVGEVMIGLGLGHLLACGVIYTIDRLKPKKRRRKSKGKKSKKR